MFCKIAQIVTVAAVANDLKFPDLYGSHPQMIPCDQTFLYFPRKISWIKAPSRPDLAFAGVPGPFPPADEVHSPGATPGFQLQRCRMPVLEA